MAVVTMKRLLESGVHFGHQTKRWNPKMSPYIFGSKNGIHIIDLQKSSAYIHEAYGVLKEITAAGGKGLFVGTKKQAQDAIETEATRCGMPYVNHRWLGGMLTNYKTIKQRVKYYRQLEEMEANGEFENMSKKDAIILRKQKEKMSSIFHGIRDMEKAPEALFVIDIKKEKNAVAEAHKLGIPVFALIDTNCDPDEVDYIIPGNDDAIRSLNLISEVVANAVLDGLQSSLEGRDVSEAAVKAEEKKIEAAADVVKDEAKAEVPVKAAADVVKDEAKAKAKVPAKAAADVVKDEAKAEVPAKAAADVVKDEAKAKAKVSAKAAADVVKDEAKAEVPAKAAKDQAAEKAPADNSAADGVVEE